ncbi:translation initiation factor IF-2-like [Frankliniella occidentalis]|uniref:Translation initiation factor IF-2-like n=1 Tax=Frankliniella occidentalis TaxID=133901 RepID=A0A9C6TXT9_FRAOC|nr:translation initiation factor IF-2-like [Frankliniella occidentalis]
MVTITMEADEEHRRPLTGGSRTPQGDKNNGVTGGQRSSPSTPEPGLVTGRGSGRGSAIVGMPTAVSPAPGPEVLLMRPESAKASPPALPPRPRVPPRPASMAPQRARHDGRGQGNLTLKIQL